jgi:hypothetical protein
VRQRSPLEAVTGVVGEAAGALRRRRVGRRPYVKLYAPDGQLTMLDSESDRAQDMIDTAAVMVDAAAPPPAGDEAEAT